MKRKIIFSLLLIAILLITGCGKKETSNNKTNTFKINNYELVFDQDAEFHDFRYKNMKGIEPDESKQAVYLDYKNSDIYDGRFVFRISLSFGQETTLKEFLNGRKTEQVHINGTNWHKVEVSNKVDNKDTTSIIYVTEKSSTLYVVSALVFNESKVDVKELSDIFINGVTVQ